MTYGAALVVPLLIAFCKLMVIRLVVYIIYYADSVLMILTSVTIRESNGII